MIHVKQNQSGIETLIQNYSPTVNKPNGFSEVNFKLTAHIIEDTKLHYDAIL